MTTHPLPPDAQGPAHAAGIHLRGLRKSYGSTVAVAGVDLDIAPGEIVALLGPNGAGKSTTIDILLGLSNADAGSVSLFGDAPAKACAKGRVGAMLQTGGLLQDATIDEMIDLMRALTPNPLSKREVFERAGIQDLAGRNSTKLSGGQTQRARFALAITPDPDLLVLDEPTAAMDVEARRRFWASMRAWAAEGRTVLFATHYMEEADSFADRIVLMRHGQVVADGSTTEIKSLVGGRTIRATLPYAQVHALTALPGVASAEVHGDTVSLACPDSDLALRHLLGTFPEIRDIEIAGAGLEDAFLLLTGDGAATTATSTSATPTSATPTSATPTSATPTSATVQSPEVPA